jgi:hypothetical protein
MALPNGSRLAERRARRYPAPWPTGAAGRRAIVEDIAWHNGTMLHGRLGCRSPAEFDVGNKIKKAA